MKKIKKICFLVSGLPPTRLGGIEIATKQILGLLSKKPIEIHVITRNTRIKWKGKTRSLKKTEKIHGYILHHIPFSNIQIFRVLIHTLFALKTIIQIKPDIIHGQQITPNGFIAVIGGLFLRKKTVVWVRGGELYSSSLLYLKSIAQFTISKATTVLAMSHHMKAYMEYLWPRKSFLILGNGVDLSKYFHTTSATSIIGLIYVGRLIKSKRVSDAIKALSRVINDSPPIRLIIIGSGPLENELKNLCIQLKIENNVNFLGQINPSKIHRYLSNADIFIFPTESEGFPNAVLEAMASGLPILASQITVIPELVRNKVNGLLHPPRNINLLSENLKMLLFNNELRHSMGEKSRELASQYSWDNIVESLFKIYISM